MIAQITAVISAIIAVISLVVSIKVYRRDTPKLCLEIIHPEYDCFFGDALVEKDGKLIRQRISGLSIQIRNPSSASIEVQSMMLRIGKESFRSIPNDNPFWDNVTFTTQGESDSDIDFNYSIPYCEYGIHLPCVVEGLSSKEGYILFYHFPASINGKAHAKLIVHTAIGAVQKKVTLHEYNRTFQKQELKDVEQYYRSLEDKQK